MAALTSPDNVASATVVINNPEQTDGAYVIAITQVAPVGAQVAVEYNGVRIYEETVAAGTGTEG